MKKSTYLLIISILICFAKYLPFPWAIESLQKAIATYSVIFHVLGIIGIIISLYLKKTTLLGFVLILAGTAIVFLSNILQGIDHRIIILYNSNKEPEHFKSPILGIYKHDKSVSDTSGRKYRIHFVSNRFFNNEVLIYSPGHGFQPWSVTESIYFKKYYNRDWYLGEDFY